MSADAPAQTPGVYSGDAAPRIGLIWAEAEGGVIGRDGGMPWHVPEDLAHFKRVTHGDPVVMGRKTWESLPPRFRPLPGRANIVVTRQSDWTAEGAEVAASVDGALDAAAGAERVWVIGGAELFRAVIDRADRLEVTELRHPDDAAFAPAPGDVLAPAIDPLVFRVAAADPPTGEHTSRTGIRFRFIAYARARPSGVGDSPVRSRRAFSSRRRI